MFYKFLGQRLGYHSPETSSWIQFHSLVDTVTLQEIFKYMQNGHTKFKFHPIFILRRFADPLNCYRLILMTTKGLCGTHVVDVERTVMIRYLFSEFGKFYQPMGRSWPLLTLTRSFFSLLFLHALFFGIPEIYVKTSWAEQGHTRDQLLIFPIAELQFQISENMAAKTI